MNKKGTITIHIALAYGQGIHQQAKVKQTSIKKKERMKNERKEEGKEERRE